MSELKLWRPIVHDLLEPSKNDPIQQLAEVRKYGRFALDTIITLLRRSYWIQVWIRQEIILPKHHIFLGGDK